MNWLKLLMVLLLALVNLSIAPIAWADPIAEKSPEYTEITQTLDQLLQATTNPAEVGYTTEALQQQITNLQLQKYIMETTEDWGVCRNETPMTVGVYAHKPKKGKTVENTLYYLGTGEETDDDWDCDGVYLPTGSKVAITPTNIQELTEPIALKITDGTPLVITANPDGMISFNLPPAQVFKANEINWLIPELAQADIDATAPNAPVD